MCRRIGSAAAVALLSCAAACSRPGAHGRPDGAPAIGDGSATVSDGGDSGGSGGSSGSGSDGGAGGSDGGAGGLTYTLRFLAGGTFTMYASIGGGPAHIVQLDTGSNGIFVPKSLLGPGAQIGSIACSITYVSSGNMLSGHYATATVTLLGSSKSGDVSPAPASAPMSVCAVEDASWNGGMIGIGFGRGSTPDPTKNLFWQWADAKAGRMRPGWLFTTHPAPAITIGLAPSLPSGFHAVQLAPDPKGSGDWQASSLRGCLTIAQAPSLGMSCGPLLVDTGIAETILWGPPDATLGGLVPPGGSMLPNGNDVSLAVPADGSAADWRFVTGSGADAPSSVDVRSAGAFSINSGRALLVDYDYLFDVGAGIVAFRRAP